MWITKYGKDINAFATRSKAVAYATADYPQDEGYYVKWRKPYYASVVKDIDWDDSVPPLMRGSLNYTEIIKRIIQ